MSSGIVEIACPDCGGSSMYHTEGRYGPYLRCPSEGCPGRRKLDADGNPRTDRAEDSATRRARIAAHDAFDPLWRNADRLYPGRKPKHSRGQARARAYAWLAHGLGLEVEKTHMDLFDRATCERVVEKCRGMTDERVREWAKAQKQQGNPVGVTEQ